MLYELLKSRGMKPSLLAEALGVELSTVSRWNSRRIPAERVHDVAAATGIAAHDLRPDIFVPPEKLPAPAA